MMPSTPASISKRMCAGWFTVQHTTCKSFFRASASNAGVTRSPRTANWRAPTCTARSTGFSICPSYNTPVISVGSTLRSDSRIATSNEITTVRGISPDSRSAPIKACSPPPGAARFQLQIEHDIMFLGKFDNFLQRGNALAGKFAAEPGASVEATQLREREVMHGAAPAGGSVHGGIVDGHEARVARKL